MIFTAMVRHANVIICCAMGFGHSSRLHTFKILRVSGDLPLVIEIVDSEEKVNAFLPVPDGLMTTSGLVTTEKVRVRIYGTCSIATSLLRIQTVLTAAEASGVPSVRPYSAREIGRTLGVARSTIQDNLTRARAAGLSWPLPGELTDDALEQR